MISLSVSLGLVHVNNKYTDYSLVKINPQAALQIDTFFSVTIIWKL